ncbi:hypothetical protein F5X71_29715 [Nocardia brasiliensis]|uniref:Head-to-tail stopper n=1 Tax=Nocardia brasiliensis TaxID=37326 RepID=A0A6G9XYC0_NOCBR|nr:hypothetical protein [Nocardia brasiliensis]QIS05928.1 hypothetical protein F5X71_29715 [Nocardia brasiliensis]
MSLLDKANESVVVYPEEVVTDADGNVRTRPAKLGFPAKATIRAVAQSGTSARRTEQDNEGYESEQLYRIRFVRGFNHGAPLGAQSQIEWNGTRWALFGDAVRFNGSRRTAHFDYLIRRF